MDEMEVFSRNSFVSFWSENQLDLFSKGEKDDGAAWGESLCSDDKDDTASTTGVVAALSCCWLFWRWKSSWNGLLNWNGWPDIGVDSMLGTFPMLSLLLPFPLPALSLEDPAAVTVLVLRMSCPTMGPWLVGV